KPKPLGEARGSFLLTHFGLSGPSILDVSRAVTAHASQNTLILECDFLPDEKRDALEQRLSKHLQSQGGKHIANANLLEVPARLWESLLAQAKIAAETRSAELSKDARRKLVDGLKATRIRISGTRGFAKAEVTAGGVDLREVDSSTMQSKLVPGL